MIEVTLTEHEIHQVALAGVMRNIVSLTAADAHRFNGTPYERWGLHIEGAAAEFVVAKKRSRFWNAVVAAEGFRGLPGDVGEMQVRSTWRRDGCLLLHESDPDDATFMLVTGALPTFRIVGWMLGRDGKKSEFWRSDTGRPAFFVPQRVLTPVGREAAA